MDKLLKESGTHYLGEYIDRRQAEVAYWVVLMKILEVCNKDTGYEGGGWQTAAMKQLSDMLKEILVEARVRHCKSSRHGEGGGCR